MFHFAWRHDTQRTRKIKVWLAIVFSNTKLKGRGLQLMAKRKEVRTDIERGSKPLVPGSRFKILF
jgi:hypothetical protein